MKAYCGRSANHVAFRAHRLDPRQESRRSLALIVLMSLATVSVMAATQALSAEDTGPVHLSSQQ
ncbi:hypothetical protein [Microvirga roseola]|uniref:hypothetical protein n=1 Tax=Microvirga roseola TaxID=2883126 RepID=UPI001E5EBFD7|nr:hypothetical protein [Microvirga roseola]